MLLLAAAALAADPEFAGAATPGQTLGPPRWALSAELGGAWSAGNTVAYTLTANLGTSRVWARNKLALQLAANVGRGLADTDGDGSLSPAERAAPMVETSRKYAADLRYDRFFGKRDSLYALAGALTDPFSGYDSRSHAQLGFSRNFLSQGPLSLVGEIGGDVAREDYVEGTDPGLDHVFAARVMGGLTYRFNPSADVSERLEVYENVLDLQDVRVLSTLAFTARLSTVLNVKLSHAFTFDHVPVDGFLPIDAVTVVTVVARVP